MLEGAVDNGPHQAPVRLVQVDDQLADDSAVAEGDGARAGSRRVSVTKPGTRRVCSAPTSRSASQTDSEMR